MFIQIIKNNENEIISHEGDCMAGLYYLLQEWVLYATYDQFLIDIEDNKLKCLTYNCLGIDKLENNFLKLYYCISEQDEKYSFIASKSEILRLTNLYYKYLMNGNWLKLYVEFDGNKIDIFIDDRRV